MILIFLFLKGFHPFDPVNSDDYRDRITSARPNIRVSTPELKDLFERMLSKNPSERPTTSELRDVKYLTKIHPIKMYESRLYTSPLTAEYSSVIDLKNINYIPISNQLTLAATPVHSTNYLFKDILTNDAEEFVPLVRHNKIIQDLKSEHEDEITKLNNHWEQTVQEMKLNLETEMQKERCQLVQERQKLAFQKAQLKAQTKPLLVELMNLLLNDEETTMVMDASNGSNEQQLPANETVKSVYETIVESLNENDISVAAPEHQFFVDFLDTPPSTSTSSSATLVQDIGQFVEIEPNPCPPPLEIANNVQKPICVKEITKKPTKSKSKESKLKTPKKRDLMNVPSFVPGTWSVLTSLPIRQSLPSGSSTPNPAKIEGTRSMMPTEKKIRKAKPCNICHDYFYDHTGVRLHKARVHGVGQLFECTVDSCEKKFATKRDLSLHISSCQRKVRFFVIFYIKQ